MCVCCLWASHTAADVDAACHVLRTFPSHLSFSCPHNHTPLLSHTLTAYDIDIRGMANSGQLELQYSEFGIGGGSGYAGGQVGNCCVVRAGVVYT